MAEARTRAATAASRRRRSQPRDHSRPAAARRSTSPPRRAAISWPAARDRDLQRARMSFSVPAHDHHAAADHEVAEQQRPAHRRGGDVLRRAAAGRRSSSGWDRRRLLVLALVLVRPRASAVGARAELCACSAVVRAATVLGAAVFTPQAAAAVGFMAPPAQRGRAITFIFLGWSVASVARHAARRLDRRKPTAGPAPSRWSCGWALAAAAWAVVGDARRRTSRRRCRLAAWREVFTTGC